MNLRSFLSLKSIYFRGFLALVILGLISLFYGYYFPKKYLFECEGTETKRMSNKITNNTISSVYRETTEVIRVFEYWYGFAYTINEFTLNQCYVDSLNEIYCYTEGKGSSIDSYSYSSDFNIDTSKYSYGNVEYKDTNKFRTSGNSFKCRSIKNALDK